MLLSDGSQNGPPSQTRAPESESVGLGELLRRARERRGLTLEQISNETKIPRRHLEALEHDNLTAGPGGFYQRAEIRAYARVVNLDQNLALAKHERALQPPVARDEPVAAPARPPQPNLARRRLLIAVGVVVAAAVLGRATRGREPALDGEPNAPSAIGSAPPRVLPVRETPPDPAIGASQRTRLNQVALPSAPSAHAMTVATEPTGARASAPSKGDLALAPNQTPHRAEAGASADSATELLVTTEPAGALVTVNGIRWGITPVTIRYLPPGDKRIRVSKDGYAIEQRVVTLAEGQLKKLDIQLRGAPQG